MPDGLRTPHGPGDGAIASLLKPGVTAVITNNKGSDEEPLLLAPAVHPASAEPRPHRRIETDPDRRQHLPDCLILFDSKDAMREARWPETAMVYDAAAFQAITRTNNDLAKCWGLLGSAASMNLTKGGKLESIITRLTAKVNER